MFKYLSFPKNLDRAINFNSVTLKNTQTEPRKCIIFFQQNKLYLELADKYKNNFINYILLFCSTLRKITVGEFVNQLIKNLLNWLHFQ